MKFMVIFFIVFLAFLVGLNNLYWYYDESVREQVQVFDSQFMSNSSPVDTKAEKAFGTYVNYCVFYLRRSAYVIVDA